MNYFFTVVGRYLAIGLLSAVALSLFGCGDSASVNPVVELASLSVDPGTLEPTFNGATTQYKAELANNISSVTVRAQAAVAGDSVTINGEATTSLPITLGAAGSTTPVNIVVSESGTNSRTYTVLLTKASLTGNNSLRSLSISPGSLGPGFDANTLNYQVSVASSVNSMRVTPTLDDPVATMTVNDQAAASGQTQTVTLRDPGLTTVINVVVNAQNGTSKQYTLIVSRAALGGNNNLRRLNVSPGSLSHEFTASRTSYTVDVGGRVDSLSVTAAPEDTNASLTIDGQSVASRSISLPEGPSSTQVEVTVTAQNGIPKTYFITVHRAALSADNNLEDLNVSPGSLDPVFSAGITQYSVEVATDVTAVTVTATKSDPNAVISGDVLNGGQANIRLDGPGTSKTVSITVTAPNETSRTYNITVNRLAPSTDANLSDLEVTSGSLNPSFRSGELTYAVDVAGNVDSITITATKSDPNAEISSGSSVIAAAGTPAGRVTISLGRNTTTTASITVTAQDKITTKTYTINVFRPER
ncbi:MAG: cadherin-like beta sandwich domain-containing protein [Nitrospira sp.]|nr:cadherin-like beta sandwich domain-containing protein [Nitrospira sp.]